MTVLTDIDFNYDQRIMTRASPAVLTSVFDLYDTIKDWEDEIFSLRHETPANAEGRLALGGGEFVGVSVVLINEWRFAYESRASEITEEGTITTGGDAVTLIDAAATFETNGVESGAIVMNKTDGSAGTVLSVDSETQLTLASPGLEGGTDNDFDSSDAYGVWNVVSCSFSEGNLIAVNSYNDNPILPTFATQVQLRQSAAPVQLLQSSTRVGSFVSG